MERPESPVQNLIKPKDLEKKLPLSPKIPKIPKGPNARQTDSAGKYIRDSPNNFRRTAEHRRESPRYAEPVRRSSRDPYSSQRNPSESIDERLAEIEQKAQKLLNSPYKSQNDSQEFYKSAPAQGFKVLDKDEVLNDDEALAKLEVLKARPPKGKK